MDRGKRGSEEHIEQLIDEALEETFPASDPPSPAVDVLPAGKEKKKPVKKPSGRQKRTF